MMKPRKSKITLFVLLLIFCLFTNQPATAQDCGDGAMSTLYTYYPTLTLTNCVNGTGTYVIGGGVPPFELWGKTTEWIDIRTLTQQEEEERTFDHTCEPGPTPCESRFEIKIIDSMGKESNIQIVPIEPEWDSDNPEEIEPNDSITVNVVGGFAPYTWQVIGNGFSLSQSQTQEPSNTLIADADACGTAIIKVLDSCKHCLVGGYVKCTVGGWIECSTTGLNWHDGGGGGYSFWEEWTPGLGIDGSCKNKGYEGASYECPNGRSGTVSGFDKCSAYIVSPTVYCWGCP